VICGKPPGSAQLSQDRYRSEATVGEQFLVCPEAAPDRQQSFKVSNIMRGVRLDMTRIERGHHASIDSVIGYY